MQVDVELRLEDCQAGQRQEAKLHKVAVEQTDRVVQKTRVLEGSVTQIEVPLQLPPLLSLLHHDLKARNVVWRGCSMATQK
jgi:Ser/Thr protein kinase RdoA (MazF antagonist)